MENTLSDWFRFLKGRNNIVLKENILSPLKVEALTYLKTVKLISTNLQTN